MDDTFAVLKLGTGLAGGLALFLYGMHTLSEGLKMAAGDGMKTLLGKLTTNRFSAAGTGAAVTAVIQSSSVTTVLVVGFVSAGLMTLNQSVGVIMGANVGTTITGQIVAFKVTALAWGMVAAGFAIWAFPRREVVKEYGSMILGLGLLFLGMDQMSRPPPPGLSNERFEPAIGISADLIGQIRRLYYNTRKIAQAIVQDADSSGGGKNISAPPPFARTIFLQLPNRLSSTIAMRLS